jgi:hypothetical protein
MHGTFLKGITVNLSEASEADIKAELNRREQQAGQLANQLRDVVDRLKGKAFYASSAQRNWVSWTAVRYLEFQAKDNQLQEKAETVSVYWYKRPSPEAQVVRKRDHYWTPHGDQLPMQPMELSHFTAVWEAAGRTAQVFMEQWTKGLNAVTAPLPDEDEAAVDIIPDVPFLQLELADVSLLPKAFMLSGSRYLLTSSSRAIGLATLAKARANLYRGREHFQECDMKYVTAREERITKLEEKLRCTKQSP